MNTVELYDWQSIGDQDGCTRKISNLGPYKLEHIEDHWQHSKMMMRSVVWLWDESAMSYNMVAKLDSVEYVYGQSYKILEDWYACNVLSEQLFIGRADE